MRKYAFFILAACILSACSNPGTKTGPKQDRIEITNDMENAKGKIPSWVGEERVFEMTNPPAHSGIYACITNDTAEYSYHYEEIFKNINSEFPKRVILNGWVYITSPNPNFSVICSITEGDQNYNWKAFPLDKTLTEVGKWVEFSGDFYLDDKPLKPDMRISIDTWNQSKKPIYIDDLKVTFLF